MEKVSIIIANYNGENFLKNCIPTVLESNYSNFEIIICDDGSNDNSVSYLKELSSKYDNVVLLQNSSNMGAAKTRNFAVSQASGTILIFLDNDTQVDPNWIDPLVKLITSSEQIGAVQSTLIDYDNRDKIQLIGTHLIPHTCWGIPLLQGQKISDIPLETQPIIALSAALAVKKSVFQKIRGFDDKLAVYTEDLEFSLRIWVSGYSILTCPQSKVYHKTKNVEARKEMNATRSGIYFHLAKNSIRTIIKNYQLKNILHYIPFTFLILVSRLFIRLYYGDPTAAKSTIYGIWWNLANISDTLNERKYIQSIRRTSDLDYMKQTFTKENLFIIYKKYFSQ